MQYSIISFLKVRELETFRFDAEYFQPAYLEIDKIVETASERFTTLEELKIKIDASAFYPSLEPYYGRGTLPFLRVVDTDSFIDYDSAITIPENILKEFKTLKSVKKGDIIVTKGGSVARVGLADRTSAVCRDLISYNTSKLGEIEYTFFFIYFLSHIYQKMLIRTSSMTAQPHLTLTLVKTLPVFNPARRFKEKIFAIYSQSKKLLDDAQIFYSEAEQTLLTELKLQNWKPKYQRSFVRNFSSTQSADRIDAEYFQPVYDEMLKAIKSAKSYAHLDNKVTIKKCVEPGSEAYQDSGVPFVRVSNLSKFGINDDNQQFISESLYESLIMHQPKKGEILLSKDATPGIAYYLNDVPGKMIPSSGILRLTVIDAAKIIPEYLTLVLNSAIVQKQIERDVGGSVINHWLVDRIKNTIIPVLDDSVQKEISGKITESFLKRKQSRSLLKIAKSGVEMAIEKSEEEALKWIKQEVKAYAQLLCRKC